MNYLVLLINITFLFISIIFSPLFAQEMDCLLLLKQKNYYAAAEQCEISAEKGDKKAQYGLATLYYKGLGVLKDTQQAFFWFNKAAKQGLRDAQYNLAIMYANGIGHSADFSLAFIWLTLASQQQYPEAKSTLQAIQQDMTEKEITLATSRLAEYQKKYLP